MRIYITSLLIFLSSNIWAHRIWEQDSTTNDHAKNINVIQSFISDLANENRATDIILSQYLKIEAPSNEIYDYLEVSLEEVRINLISKNIEDIRYTPFNQMPPKEIRDIDPEELDTNSMYFLHYKKRQMLAVYMENGKIGSFTLVSKGNNKAHFVIY